MDSDSPVLKAYDPSLFWKIDWRILLADLPYLFFGIYFSSHVANEKILFNSISPVRLLELFCLVMFLLPWYLGFVLVKYRASYPFAFSSMVSVAFILGFFTQVVLLLSLSDRALKADFNNPDNEEWFIYLFSLFMLVLSPMSVGAGYKMGAKAFLREDLDADKYVARLISLTCSIALFLVLFLALGNPDRSSGMRIVFFAGELATAVLSGMGLFRLMRIVKRFLVRKGIFYRIAFVFENFFPLIITCALIIWSGVGAHAAHHFMLANENSGLAGILALLFSGVLPYRIFLLLNPPLRGINLAIGTASFVFYVWTVAY